MSDPFVTAVNFVIDVLEGGGALVYDSGGATRFGISKRGNPDIDVEQLSREEAVRLYHERYWRPSRADELPPALALVYFAAYVNMRSGEAVRCLQRAADVQVDGILGPTTLAGAQGFRPQSEIRARFSRAAIESYLALVRERPVHTPSLHGWIGRVCRAADEAGRWGDAE